MRNTGRRLVHDQTSYPEVGASGAVSLARLPGFAAWFARIVLGVVVLDLLGWVFGVQILTSALAGWATMKPNTAIGIGLLAIGCMLRRQRREGRATPRWAALPSLAAALLSGITLAEIVLHRNFGIDTLFLHVPPDRFGDPAGRMAPGTAFCILLSGCALWLLDRLPRVSTGMVLTVIGVSASAVVGFAFDAGPLFGVPALRSLSMPTALTLLLLQLATLALRPEREPVVSLMQKTMYGGRTSWLLPGVTIVPLLLSLPLLTGLRLGWYDAPFAMALLVVLLTGVQTFILWRDSAELVRLERRRVMAEAALLQSEKLAVVGRLAASISHEINNPLEAVGNLLYLVRAAETTEQAREYALIAEEELGRVAQITAQTLSFYRENRQSETCSATKVLESALRLLRSKIDSSGVRLQCEFAGVFDGVRCRDGELRQVFINLIANALDATPSGGRLRVRTRVTHDWRDARGQVVRITIADTGSGIPPAVQQKIFEPFFTTKAETGNGLGLWVARDLLEKQGGAIGLRSSVQPAHSGTVFSVVLPVGEAEDAHAVAN